MSLPYGFKAEAKRLALEVRDELGVDVLAPLDPYELAELYGIQVHDLSGDDLPAEAVAHLTGPGAETFSGALVAVGSGSIIIENHVHAPRRRRATIAHEMSHVLLEHEFGVLVMGGEGCDGLDGRGSSRSRVELEATELSGELLVPCDAARVAAFRGWTDATVARHFHVSESLARWRMNVTGARRVAVRTRRKWYRHMSSAAHRHHVPQEVPG